MPSSPEVLAQPADRIVGCTCFRIRRLARRVTQLYDRALAPCGLRVTQFSLLSQLVWRDRQTIGALSDALDMDRTTLTRNLKPLIELRFVRLATGADDARVRVVVLTPAGRRRHAEARHLWRRAQDELNATWGVPQMAPLHHLFDGLIETFNAKATATAPQESA